MPEHGAWAAALLPGEFRCAECGDRIHQHVVDCALRHVEPDPSGPPPDCFRGHGATRPISIREALVEACDRLTESHDRGGGVDDAKQAAIELVFTLARFA